MILSYQTKNLQNRNKQEAGDLRKHGEQEAGEYSWQTKDEV